jgi:membrane protein YqaA with SNARE-associated domain
MFMLEFLLVEKVHQITLSHYLGNTLGFLAKYFIGIQVKNNLMVTGLLDIDKLNEICNKLFPWIQRSWIVGLS